MTLPALLRPVLAAVLLQGLGLLLVGRAADGAYGGNPSVSEATARAALIAALVLGGVVAGGLALRSLYRLHLHRRAGIAFPATLLHLPVLAVAVAETQVLLVLVRAW